MSNRNSPSGLMIPGTRYFKFEMSNADQRPTDFRKLLPVVANSLLQGDNAYIHCMSGVHRAPLAAAVLAANLHDEALEDSMKRIESVRTVALKEALQSMGGRWLTTAANLVWSVWPKPDGWAVAHAAEARIHASITSGGEVYPLCKWKQAGTEHYFKTQPLKVGTLEEALGLGRFFCRACEERVRASTWVKLCAHANGIPP